MAGESADQERRSRLLSLKLRALVREHLGLATEPEGRAEVFGLGAAFVTADATWLFVDGSAQRSVGPSLAWALAYGSRPDSDSQLRKDGASINIIVERDSALLARRGAMFDLPVFVWHVNERLLLPAVEEPPLPFVEADPRHLEFVSMIERSGAQVVIEHGVVVGEVRGLEICRVVDDQFTGETRLEVGMGAHDREAFALIHGHMPTDVALRSVVETVLQHRRTGAPAHPLNTFGAERLMRARCIENPSLLGLKFLEPGEPPVLRNNIKDAVPCVAIGTDTDGRDAVVTFTHGVDLDAVPFALDAAHRISQSARVMVVAREKDMVASMMKLGVVARRTVELCVLAPERPNL